MIPAVRGAERTHIKNLAKAGTFVVRPTANALTRNVHRAC